MSPLEQIEGLAERKWSQGPMEKRTPYVVPPWWEPPRTKICRTKEASIMKNMIHTRDRNNNALDIYTDDSGINGKIGASAYAPQLEATQRKHLGDDEHFTMYAGELKGIDMAYQIAMDTKPPALNIWTDNQAAIESTANPQSQSGQYILKRITTKLAVLRENNIPVTIRWIAAHKNVPGNERADQLAKEASQQATKGPQICLLSAAKQRIRRLTNKNWATAWGECDGNSERELKRYVPEPHHRVMSLHEGVQKAVSSVVTQLRTKIALKDLLYVYRAVDTPECPCGEGRQTRDHVLRHCPLFEEERWATWGGRTISVRKILTKPETAIRAAKFMIKTQTLKVFQTVQLR